MMWTRVLFVGLLAACVAAASCSKPAPPRPRKVPKPRPVKPEAPAPVPLPAKPTPKPKPAPPKPSIPEPDFTYAAIDLLGEVSMDPSDVAKKLKGRSVRVTGEVIFVAPNRIGIGGDGPGQTVICAYEMRREILKKGDTLTFQGTFESGEIAPGYEIIVRLKDCLRIR